MTELALCWLTIPRASPVELIHAAAAGGFARVGMKVVEPGRMDIGVFGNGAAAMASVRRASAAEGVPIYRTSGFRLDERYVKRRYDRFLETSAALGASDISVIATDPVRSRLPESLADLCVNAAEHGLRVTVEFAPFSTVPTLDAAVELIRQSEQSSAAIILDALHFFRSGGKPTDLTDSKRSAIAILQLCDAPTDAPSHGDLLREARTDRLDLGSGALPLVELLEALPQTLLLELEVPCRADRDLAPTERAIRSARAARVFLEDISQARSAIPQNSTAPPSLENRGVEPEGG